MTTMTIEELLAEVSAACRDDGGHTCEEWAEQMGCGVGKARRSVKRLLKAGKMKSGKAPRTDMRGVVYSTDVYRIIAA